MATKTDTVTYRYRINFRLINLELMLMRFVSIFAITTQKMVEKGSCNVSGFQQLAGASRSSQNKRKRIKGYFGEGGDWLARNKFCHLETGTRVRKQEDFILAGQVPTNTKRSSSLVTATTGGFCK